MTPKIPLMARKGKLAVVVSIVLAATACMDQDETRVEVASVQMSYPDWEGQWERIGSLNWPPEGYAAAGPAPLTPEYQAIKNSVI